jgi:preprotein translocase subunit YajC
MIMRLFALAFLLAQQSLMAQTAGTSAPAAQPMAQDPVGGMIKSFGLMGVFVLAMWFLLIAPQRKKAKELETTLKSLRAGDKIVTNSGILGVILSIKDKTLSIRSADTKLEILKSSILEVLERGGDPGESKS